MLKQPVDVNLWTEFHKYFTAFVVEDIRKSLQSNIEVGTIILTTVGIECLSGYFVGQETERKHFVNFMQVFMPPYAKYADDVYACIRNGLAHDYVIKENSATNVTFVFQRNHGEPHLIPTPMSSNVIYLNREDYANDFLVAQHDYFEKVENDQTLWDNAIKRLKSQRGFLTVRPLSQLVTPTTGVSYPGTVANSSATSLSTGTSSKPQGSV
ncbi:MAG TPA: hypothetical protein PKK96_14745 [Anaerolineales bacterium]|jgi:hypothetical protein|nr:hypothetical protein [Anaerolineales bacterium]HNQ94573.1 hypothetical protein [Anaerolineales bacterium]HNS62258.1 hypothetical protein [Anaerolineales bacterium]